MNTRTRTFRAGIATALLLALVWVFPANAQEQSGEITSVQPEARVIGIDGREYRLAPKAQLGTEHDDQTIVSPMTLSPGMQVNYSLIHAGDDDSPRISRLIILEQSN